MTHHTGIRRSEAIEEGDRHDRNSYVSWMVNLTTLAPDIIAAILDDTLLNNIILFDLAVDTPVLWEEQWMRIKSALPT